MSDRPEGDGLAARVSRWSIRGRMLATLLALLLFTALGAWALTGGAVLKPLLGAVVKERVEVAAFVAREVRHADDPQQKVAELSEELGVEITLSVDRPEPSSNWVRRIGRGRRVAYVEQAPGSPIHVPLGPRGRGGFLTVTFDDNLERPGRIVALGTFLILLFAGGGALLMTRWATRPLDVAGSAMARIAGGELDHRLPEGNGEAGQMARSFNEMASQVEDLIEGERRLVEGQRRLMGAVSHELRTPLARMRLQTEMLRDDGADARRVDSIERQIAEVDSLVGELVESLRLERGVMALDLEEIGVHELISEVLADAELGERPVSLDLQADLNMVGDRRRLARVLRNLLSNVARYTPEDAPVRIEASGEPGEVRIAVVDGGRGVPEGRLEELFEPFFRLESSRSKATGGLGLGLMLVRQIVEAHGGQVVARNEPAGGLRVELGLPEAGPEGS